MEREAEQPLLATCAHAAADVEERRRAELAADDDADRPALLDDVEPAGLAARRREANGAREPADDGARTELDRPLCGPTCGTESRDRSGGVRCDGGQHAVTVANTGVYEE